MKTKITIKKFQKLSLLLFICLSYLGSYGQTATAPSGAGTSTDPYQIATLENLYWISQNSGEWGSGKHYIQTADIDAAATSTWSGGWPGIGASINYSPIFTGHYNGNGKKIENLTIDDASTSAQYRGLFNRFDGEVYDLKLVNPNYLFEIQDGTFLYLGGIAGGANGNAKIERVSVISGTINLIVDGPTSGNGWNTGGLLGMLSGSAVLKESFVNGTVIELENKTGTSVRNTSGGLMGTFRDNAEIHDCFSKASVSATIQSTFQTGSGGIAGRFFNTPKIYNSYSASSIATLPVSNSNASNVMGAVFGWFQPSTGFVFSNIYYNSDLYSSCIGNNYNNVTFTCNSGSTADMNQQNHFSGYDFVNTWGIDPTINDGYPYLLQNLPPIDCNNFLAEAPTLDNGVYQISTFNHLRWISENSSSWGADFIQTADIDAVITSDNCYNSGEGWLPIGNSTTKFTGSYDGDGHTISNLFINRPNEQRIALFGENNGATIQNLGLIDPDITVTGTGFFGTGSNVGSLVGLADNGTSISECFATGGSVSAGGSGVGGLIGQLLNSNLNNSYAIVAVEGGDANVNYSAGLVGVNSFYSTITNCYAAGSVAFKQYSGITVSRGLTQGSNGITYSFYDSDATGHSTGASDIVKTTVEMQQQATFTNWDFQCEAANGTANIWGIDEGNDYPRLSWEGIVQLCKSWIGSINTDWSNPNNWSPSGVPTQNENLIIDATAQNNLILNQDQTVGNITFNAADVNITLNNNDLTFTGLISGADANNYIQTNGTGKIKANIASNDTVRFEVGHSTYNPVEIQPTVTDTFAVVVLDTVMYNNYLYAANYVNRTWEITKADSMAGGSVNFVYYWNANEIVNGPMNAPILNHYNGNNWENANGINTPGGGNPILSLSHTNYTGAFSPFAISDASTPLPVDFLGMDSECEGKNSISLTWETASELNAKLFEVLRSYDGYNWNKVGEVAANGTTNNLSKYRYEDNNLRTQGAVTYYRLKQIDYDGKFEYLPIISNSCGEGNLVSLYPNPAKDKFFVALKSNMSKSIKIRLIDSHGKVAVSQNVLLNEGLNTIPWSTSDLAPGLYYLHMDSEFENVAPLKVVVNN